MSGEVRQESRTGGQKGQKPNRQDLISAPFLTQLGLVCGMGAEKYDDDNWRKGYSWRLSYGAMMRHLHAFWTGEEFDEESGLPHLAHAAWHCMVLYTFSNNRPRYGEFDDRPDIQVPVNFEKLADAISRAQEEGRVIAQDAFGIITDA